MPNAKGTLIALALSLSKVYAGGGACSSGTYCKTVSALSTYAPALSYCTSKYPPPSVTSTTTTTVSAVTTVTDTTSTVITVRTTETNTVTDGTTTITVTSTQGQKRRRSPATATSKFTSPAKMFSSLQAAPASAQKTVCGCIEKPKTIVSTSTRTAVKSTAHATITNTRTSTATDTTTTHVTATATTTTVVAAGPPCTREEDYTPPGSQNIYYLECGYSGANQAYDTTVNAPGSYDDLKDCLDYCAAHPQGTSTCGSRLNRNTLGCECYYGGQFGCYTVRGAADSNFDVAINVG